MKVLSGGLSQFEVLRDSQASELTTCLGHAELTGCVLELLAPRRETKRSFFPDQNGLSIAGLKRASVIDGWAEHRGGALKLGRRCTSLRAMTTPRVSSGVCLGR